MPADCVVSVSADKTVAVALSLLSASSLLVEPYTVDSPAALLLPSPLTVFAAFVDVLV